MTPTRVIPISVGIKIIFSPKMIITIDAIIRMFFNLILNKITAWQLITDLVRKIAHVFVQAALVL